MNRISSIIYKYRNNEFKWGQLDCCIFTVKVVEEFHNIELPYWRDVLEYSDWEEAKQSLKKLKCRRLEDLPGVILNTKKREAIMAKTGDPVLYKNEDGIPILGICNGVRAYFLCKNNNLTARKLEECEASWSVK